jgi:uncharacterized protein YjiS (DUF1127 family)
MNLLHRMRDNLELRRKRAEIHRLLIRLEPRALADIGLEPDDVADVARLGATLDPKGMAIAQVLAQLRAEHAGHAKRSRAQAAETRAFAYSPPDFDRILADARRLHAETMAGFGRAVGHKLAELARRATTAVADTGIGRSVAQKRAWRAAYRDMYAQLNSYSDRELLADLRLSRSEIHDIAAEAADDRVAQMAQARHRDRATAWVNAGRPA